MAKHPFDDLDFSDWHPLQKTSWKPPRGKTAMAGGGVSSSPAATGLAGDFVMGTTRSGQKIRSYFNHPSHGNLVPAEHAEAARFHKLHVEHMKREFSHVPAFKELRDHHVAQFERHARQAGLPDKDILATAKKLKSP